MAIARFSTGRGLRDDQEDQREHLFGVRDCRSRSHPVTGLEIPEHDYIDLSYTGSNLTGVVYKTGGSGGTTVATLTLAYDGNDNLISVTKS
jgi:hypothetical protein